MDKDTQALTLYVPGKSEKASAKLKSFIKDKLTELSIIKSRELFLFICLYIVFDFFGFCLSVKDNSVFVNYSFLNSKRMLLILAFDAVFSFTVFGKIVTSATVSFIGFNFGIEYYLTEFTTEGGKLGSIPKIFILLLISFALLLYLLKLFCFSKRADNGKQTLFERRALVVHISFICISLILIYFLFCLYYNI